MHALLHENEVAALGDAGYQGVEKHPENRYKTVTWHVAMTQSRWRIPGLRPACGACRLLQSFTDAIKRMMSSSSSTQLIAAHR